MTAGTILCWAANPLGEQEQPCTFHIIPAGPPSVEWTFKVMGNKLKILKIQSRPDLCSIFAGPPEAPHDCRLNVTEPPGPRALHLSCIAGFDGGLPQLFRVLVFSDKVNKSTAYQYDLFRVLQLQTAPPRFLGSSLPDSGETQQLF